MEPNHRPVTSAPAGTSWSNGSSADAEVGANVLGISPGASAGLGDGCAGDDGGSVPASAEDALGGGGGLPHAPIASATATIAIHLRIARWYRCSARRPRAS